MFRRLSSAVSAAKKFIHDQYGVTGIEYGLVLAAVALSVGVVMLSVGDVTRAFYASLPASLQSCEGKARMTSTADVGSVVSNDNRLNATQKKCP